MKEYKQVIEEFNEMKSQRSNWDVMYQVLGEYISQMKQNFQGQPSNGEFLTEEIFDSTGTFAAYNAASALLGMLWPGTAKGNIEITPPEDMPESTELAKFYGNMTNKATTAMDDPKANLALALDEYMLDQMIFGTSGVGVERGDKSKLLFKSYGVKELYLDEGKNGLVNKIALLYEWSAARVVDEYGEENVSEKTRKAAQSGGKDKVKILIMISPRKEKKAIKGKLAMDYQSLHLEYDTCHLLKEDGFHELPIAVARFRKLNYEKMGRSNGMNALPDIREANALREAVIVATEKTLDMPIGVIDDGMLGGGYIDTSPRAVTVFNASGNIGNTPPVFNIGEVPDIRYAEARLEKLAETISQHFGIDRLIDFNNDTQMTFGEAQIRDQLRTASLLGLFSRQISEVFTPLMERSINMLWRDGEFGVLEGSEEEAALIAKGKEPTYFPDEIKKRLEAGEDVYQITYKTKAANASKAEEYIAIIDVMTFAAQAMAVDESIRHRVNLHKGIKTIADIRALPVGTIRQDDEVDELIKVEQQQMQQMQQMQMAEQAAGAYEKAAKGDAAIA
jgi:hypothetical protein